MNRNERIIHFYADHLGIKQSAFADLIGLGRERVRRSLMPDNNPTADFFDAVFKKFPELSAQWVFSGKGEMLHNKPVHSGVHEPETNYKTNKQDEQEIEDCSKWKAEVERLTKERDALIEDNEILRDYFRMLKKKEKK